MIEATTQTCARARRRRRFLPAVGRFGRDPSGASALEFALLAVPLVLLLFAAFEIALVYVGTYMLESAAGQGARLIRTGQAQTKNFDAAKFKAEVCKHLTPPITCGGLKIDVRRFSSFGGANFTNPLDANGNLKTSFNYEPGQGGDVVLVRAFYEWDLTAIFPKEISLGNMNNGNRLLVATVAFRNEPFK